MLLGEEEEGVGADLQGTSGGSGEHGGYGERRRRRRAPLGSVREREQRRGRSEGELRESERGRGERGGVRGSLGCLQRRAGKQEVAGALRARATPRLCLLAEEEEDKGGRWAGPAGGLHRGGGAGPAQVSAR